MNKSAIIDFTAYFGQMRYRVNDENIVVRASWPLRGVPHEQREALYSLVEKMSNP